MRSFLIYAGLLLGPVLGVRLLTGSSSAAEWALDLTMMGHLAWFCLRAAASGLQAITRERDLGTWEALCTTLLTPAEIYRGKIFGVLRPLVPCLVLFALVGKGPLVLLSAVYAWFFAALGLYVGLRARGSQEAGRLTWGLVGLVGVAPMLVALALAAERDLRFDSLVALSPPLAFMSVYVRETSFRGVHQAWALSALIYGGLAVVVTGLGWYWTGRPLPSRGVVRRKGRALGHVEHPVAYRAACGHSWLASGAGLGLLVAASAAILKSTEQGYLVFTLAAEAYLCVRAVAAGVGVIAGEREKRTLEVLLATPLSVASLVGWKARMALVPVLRDLAVLGVITVGAGVAADYPAWRVAASLAVMGASVLFFGALGLWFSAREGTVLKAMQKAYLGLGMLALGSLGVDIALSEMHRDTVLFLFVNPVMVMLSTSLQDWGNSFWAARWLIWTCVPLYLVGAVWCYRGALRRLQVRD